MKNIFPGANILPYKGVLPKIDATALIANGAQIAGDVEIGFQSSIWFNVAIRGDVHYVRIGQRTNVQDNSTIHVTTDIYPCIIGNEVTIGHGAIIHACTIEDRCLIGMGAIVMDNTVIQENSIVGAGSLVTMGKRFPPGSMIMGSPARVVRRLTESEIAGLAESAAKYVHTAANYLMEA